MKQVIWLRGWMLCILLGMTQASCAQHEIKPAEAKNYINKNVEVYVTAIIAEVNPHKSLTYINLEKKHPYSPLTLIIFDSKLRNFKNELLFQKLAGKTIRVRGKVTDFKNNRKPQIILDSPSQVDLIGS